MKTMLSSSVSIADYKRMEGNRDRSAIAKFMKERLSERYINSMQIDTRKKKGFTIMVISCLLIETLESFFQGWSDTNNKSQFAFRNFFDRNSGLKAFRGEAQSFYKHVRCGVLHQGETTGGWRIRRDGPLFQKKTKTINAKLFHDEIGHVLECYCNELQASDWSAPIWKSFRKKMHSVCKNCEREA